VVGGAPRHHQPAPSPTNNGFLGSGTTTTTSSSSPHTSGGSPASNVMVGNASPSHTQTLSHKVGRWIYIMSRTVNIVTRIWWLYKTGFGLLRTYNSELQLSLLWTLSRRLTDCLWLNSED
jgi:hypothetical protein